jgi:hypothetical protein
MEIAVSAIIFMIIIVVFIALKFEETNKVLYEKQLIKRYFEIQKINPYQRISYLKEWEDSALESLNDSRANHSFSVVSIQKSKKN